MKKQLVLLTLCMLLGWHTQAQDIFIPPDYEAIEKATTDPDSDDHYPKLMKRYKEGDTTLTIKEYRKLYYGNFFFEDADEPDYELITALNDSLKTYEQKDSLTEKDYRRVIELSEMYVESTPFNMRRIYELYGLHMMVRDTAKAEIYMDKVSKLVRTILSTGDGLTEKTAFHVLEVGHEYFILSAIGFSFGGSQSLTRNQCDYLTVMDNDAGVEGLYFDVNQIFEQRYRKMFAGAGDDFLEELEKEQKKDKDRKKKDKK